MSVTEQSPPAPSLQTDPSEIAALRREFVAEALDGMIFQAQGTIRFLERGDDRCAGEAMKRLFEFARHAAGEMRVLLGQDAKPSRAELEARRQRGDAW